MSREHQKYSIGNQQAAIAAYAAEHGYEIVRTYKDAGISGLGMQGRTGLQELLADTLSGRAPFSAILVLDVSRWGRFQDPDQAAHYEFVCRQAGVQVTYCAEPFDNDGSMVSGIVKHLKRAMAAEYSRELSAKTAHAQARASAAGFWRGGPAPYGFRRCAVSPDGTDVQMMRCGDRKALQGYRTVLVPGPPEEVANVRRIFRLFAIDGLSVRSIAQHLQEEVEGDAAAWTMFRVKRLLTDEKYVGTLVAGRVRCRLKSVTVQPRDRWVRVADGCPRLVPPWLFQLVQSNMPRRRATISDEALLDELREALAVHGRLSNDIIERHPGAHCPSVYIKRFGGLGAAYRRVGYVPSAAQRAATERVFRYTPHRSRGRAPKRSDEQMVRDLRAILARHGRLTAMLIDGDEASASSSEYRRRFGTMADVYALVGYSPPPAQTMSLAIAARRRQRARDPATPCGDAQ